MSPKYQIEETRKKLKDVHLELRANPMDYNLHKQETELQSNLGYWLGKEEDEIRQEKQGILVETR